MTNKKKELDAALKNYFLNEISNEKKSMPKAPIIPDFERKLVSTVKKRSKLLFRELVSDLGFAAMFLIITGNIFVYAANTPSNLALSVNKSIESGTMEQRGKEAAKNLELIAIEGHKWALSKTGSN